MRTNSSFKYRAISTTDTKAPLCNFVERFGRQKKRGKKEFGAEGEDYNIKLNCQRADLPNVKQYIFICLAGRSKEAVLSKSKQRWLTFQHSRDWQLHINKMQIQTRSQKKKENPKKPHTLIFTHLAFNDFSWVMLSSTNINTVYPPRKTKMKTPTLTKEIFLHHKKQKTRDINVDAYMRVAGTDMLSFISVIYR